MKCERNKKFNLGQILEKKHTMPIYLIIEKWPENDNKSTITRSFSVCTHHRVLFINYDLEIHYAGT